MYPQAVQELIQALTKLPGVGRRTAERYAMHLVRSGPGQARALAEAIVKVGQEVCTCSSCFNLADRDPCPICADPHRDPSLVCVVEGPADLAALEAAGAFKGLYHVLSGPLEPLEGIGPDNLRIRELIRRAKSGKVQEIIIATNPTTEGEATADLVARSLEGAPVKLTRLGYGMPVGGDVKYMDGLTLSRSLESRQKVD